MNIRCSITYSMSPYRNTLWATREHSHHARRPPGRPFRSRPTPALAKQAMQAAKPAKTAKPTKPVPACAQPTERFGDDNTSVTMPTTTRTNKVEHASRHARSKSVRAFPFGLRTCHDPVVTPARVLSAALLFLPLAATACPIGWTPPPTNATWGPRCYLIPPERSTSLFRCVDL